MQARMEVKKLSDTLSDVEAEALVLLLPQRVSDVRAQNVRFTLSYWETKSLINPLGHTLAVMEADTFADTLGDVKAKALRNACLLVLLR